MVALRTFSKAYGLAGVRVGYAFGPREIIAALNAVAIPFQVSAVAQAGAIASLEATDAMRARTDETVAVRDEVADDRVPNERHIANHVQNLVAHEFIIEPQRVVQHAGVADDDSVLQ